MSYQETPEIAALRARVRASTKEAVVLEEMQRLGFWPKDVPPPDANDPQSEAARLLARESELVRELQELGRVSDPEAALATMRKERMAAARARREETRRKRAQQRFDRASAWHQRNANGIAYLGEGVSAGLANEATDTARLEAKGLPVIAGCAALAQAMGVELGELRFLAYQRAVGSVTHYHRFTLPKKSGGTRAISAPMPRMKRAQYWVLDTLLARLPVHAAAQGFVPGRSILSNAKAHVGRAVVVNLDLKDFFPSILYPRVKGLFSSFGYSESVSTVLALLCTEPPSETVEIDGRRWHVHTGPRALPQGAPTSPAITNLLCLRLDKRLTACAKTLGFTYTRYADDMTFSAPPEHQGALGTLLWRVKRIIREEGFSLHPDKQRVMHAGRRQEVTGVVVNQRPAIARDVLKRFRATLFQVEKDGPEGKSWNGNPNVIAALEGYARYVRMIDPAKGAPLLARVAALKSRHAGQPVAAPTPLNRRAFRAAAAQGRAPREAWWTPAARPEPLLEQTPQQIAEKKAEQRAAAQAEKRAAQPQAHAGGNTAYSERRGGFASWSRNVGDERAPAGSVPEASAGEGAGSTDSTPAKTYLFIALQWVWMLMVSALGRNPVLFVAAMAWLVFSIKRRKVSWLGWVVILFGCRYLWRWLKANGYA